MKLVVDDTPVQVAVGATVLDAVNRLGVPLPQLCKDPDRARPARAGPASSTSQADGMAHARDHP